MTGSNDDPDFSDAWDKFGDPAVVVFWTVLEIYGKEFSSLNDGWLTLSIPYFERKLRRKWKNIEKILEFFQIKERIYFKRDQQDISIRIPKFIELASNWTKRTSSRPQEAPIEKPTEAPTAKELEEEVEVDKDIKASPAKSTPVDKSNPREAFLQKYTEFGEQISALFTDQRQQRQIALFVESHIRNGNLNAIIHCLNSLIVAKKKETKAKPLLSCTAYLEDVFSKENGNFNEQKNITKAAEHKKPGAFSSIGELLAAMPKGN